MKFFKLRPSPAITREPLRLLDEPNKKLLKILSKDSTQFQKEQTQFIESHFTTLVKSLNNLTQNQRQAYQYNQLSAPQIEKIVQKTGNEASLIRIFDNLSDKQLNKSTMLSFLLNKATVNPTIINKMMYRATTLNYKQVDLVCLQVGLTQKFFSLNKLDFVHYLVKLNFSQNWIAFIQGQDRTKYAVSRQIKLDGSDVSVLPLKIERSIWRIFYLFVKNASLVQLSDLKVSSLFLMLEAIPQSNLQSCNKQEVVQELRARNSLTGFQYIFLDILTDPFVWDDPQRFNIAKLFAIKSNISLDHLLANETTIEDRVKTLHLRDPLSKLIFNSKNS